MFELSSQTRVAELQAESPAMLEALMSTGMFREGDDPNVTIDELCYGFGLNPVIILNVLAKVRATETPDQIDLSELDGLTLTGVVEHIESRHHDFLRDILPRVGNLLEQVVAAHGSAYPRLADVQALFMNMAGELERHMLHEEEALFPMVRDMDGPGKIGMTRCGDSVGGPIACMENEHTLTKEQLAVLRQLTDNYAPPAQADAPWRELNELLVEFDRNTVLHIEKEDRILFPGALKAQKALRRKAF